MASDVEAVCCCEYCAGVFDDELADCGVAFCDEDILCVKVCGVVDYELGLGIEGDCDIAACGCGVDVDGVAEACFDVALGRYCSVCVGCDCGGG